MPVKRALALFALSVAAVGACAAYKAGRTKLADGSYKLTCGKPLAECLTDLTDVCKDHGYDVVSGQQTIRRNGVEPVDSEIIESEAIVRCRAPSTVFGAAPAPSASSAAVQPRAGAQHCFPGSTQACLGPAACQGAQVCAADGSRFGPCDCGATVTPLAGKSEGDAGPPPTWAVPSGDAGAP